MMDVSVHTFPSVDHEFRYTTRKLLAESWTHLRDTERLIDTMDRLIAELEGRLRERYPAAVVRLKDAQAELGHPEIHTLYAFRDGRAA